MNDPCTWAPNHRGARECGRPGATTHLGCQCLHVYTAVLCVPHRGLPGKYCHYCATGPAGHKCQLTVLEVAGT